MRPIVFIASLIILTAASLAGAQATTPSTPPVTQDWSYGGFADVSFLWAPNDPPNKLFRSRGTAWHLNDPHLNMPLTEKLTGTLYVVNGYWHLANANSVPLKGSMG